MISLFDSDHLEQIERSDSSENMKIPENHKKLAIVGHIRVDVRPIIASWMNGREVRRPFSIATGSILLHQVDQTTSANERYREKR